MTLKEAKELLQIDLNRLDEVLLTFAPLYSEIAEQFIEAKSVRDELKDKVEEVWSRCFLEVKQNNPKLTDSQAKAQADTDKRYLDALADYFLAKRETDLWEKMLESWDKRAGMIKNICDLIVSGKIDSIAIRHSRDELYEEIKKNVRR